MTSASRAERAEEARWLRDQRVPWHEAIKRMGISRSYYFALLTDPDGSGDKARKRRYDGTCATCGGRTDGSARGRDNAPKECAQCQAQRLHDERYWTPERVVAAIQEFARRYGRPPIAPDWVTAGRGDGFPPVSTVQREFGAWADAIEAAGFPRPRAGHYGRPGEDPEVVAETVRLYRSGLSCAEIGACMGCSKNAIRVRLIGAAEPRRPAHRRTNAEREALAA